MTETEKTSTSEEATPEETQAKEEREFDSALYRLVAITGLISFYGPIIFPFLVFPLSAAVYSVGLELLAHDLFLLLFFAIPISAIVGLFSCLLLWVAPTTKSDLKVGIVFSALADVFGLGVSALAPYILIALSPFGD